MLDERTCHVRNMEYTPYLFKEVLSVAALGEALGHIGQLDPAQFADAGQLGLVAEDVVFAAAGAVVRVETSHPVQVAPSSPRHVAQQAPSQAVTCSALLYALALNMEGSSVSRFCHSLQLFHILLMDLRGFSAK